MCETNQCVCVCVHAYCVCGGGGGGEDLNLSLGTSLVGMQETPQRALSAEVLRMPL